MKKKKVRTCACHDKIEIEKKDWNGEVTSRFEREEEGARAVAPTHPLLHPSGADF